MQDMANIARKVDEAKGMLQAGDKMSYISPESEPIDFNLTARWAPEELDELSIKETTKFEKMPLILIVKRPDYLGKSKWDFRQGKKSISARIDDQEWLSRFQARKIDVRPGDALRCLVTIEHKYGFDNELLNEEYIVTFIEGVLENQVSQDDLDL
jgi:hypothetical protein